MSKSIWQIFIILLANVCWFNACFGQQLGFYFEKPRKKISIPFEIYNNLIVVKTQLNDTYPLQFIIDTGVRPTILIDKDYTDSIELKYQREIELFGVGSAKSIKASVVQGISLSLPGLQSSNLSVIVLHENFLQLEKHLGIRIDGILGYEFFNRFIVKINYQKQKIELFEPVGYKPPKKYTEIELDMVDSKPIINLEIQQEQGGIYIASLLMDTGASHALVLDPLSDRKINIPTKYIHANLGRSIAGELQGKLGRIEHLNFGKYTLSDVLVSYIDGQSSNINSETDRNGSIGSELMRKFTVIFDYYHKKIYVKPNKLYKQPFEYNMSGLEFIAEGKDLNVYIINSIRTGSAADEIGFKPGDQLISLNHQPEEKLTLSKIYGILSEKEGKKITMTVNRNGSFISRTFLLKKEI